MNTSPIAILSALIVISTFEISLAKTPTEDQRFEVLAAEWWEDTLQRDPLFATRTGDHRFNDRLPEISVDAVQRHAEQLREFQQAFSTIDGDQLSLENQINYQIVRRGIHDNLEEIRFRMYLIPITNRSGFHISFPELRNSMPLSSVADYENYVSRLRGFKTYAAGHVDVMRQGIEEGMTLPSVVLQKYRDPITAHIVDDPTQSLMYAPLRNLPASVPTEDHDSLREAAQDAIRETVVPGYRMFLKFMTNEYVPAARGSLGASALPSGREFYRHRVRRFTTLDLTPEQVHQIGLGEVERIRGEMRQIMRRVEFDGGIRQFADSLRADPRFQAKSPEDLMKEAALILKRMDGRLPTLFRTLPRTPYGLKQIPSYIAPQTTTAYYQPPPGDRRQAGFYYLNTYDLKSRPLYGLVALSLHEAVPGHHLQLALQIEMENLPTYRRFTRFTVFIEGWALYAERLGLEVGFYEDPYIDFGRLTYEMWRACRLVVDTGIHYLGWTRSQAVQYMADNTALSLHNIRAEVDRYISWPGQALAYKIGELKIRQLRREAEETLQERFDVREFHDVVLSDGSVPLDVLTRNVRSWVKSMGQ